MPLRGEIIRLGGDEFLTLIPNCPEESCVELISQIREDNSQKSVEGISLSSSFGAVTIVTTQETLSDAMSKADALMY